VAAADPVTRPSSSGQPTSGRQQLLYVVSCAAAGAVLGLPGGLVWVLVAGPPAAALTADGVYFGEAELDSLTGVSLWFLAVGAMAGLLAGLVVGWLGQRHGVATVFAVLACCAAAAVVSYWTGVHVFGADEQAQLADAEVGDQITSGVTVDTYVVLLGWPIGGLIGGLAAMFGWSSRDFRGSSASTSSGGIAA
jgi:hypothetical protein